MLGDVEVFPAARIISYGNMGIWEYGSMGVWPSLVQENLHPQSLCVDSQIEQQHGKLIISCDLSDTVVESYLGKNC